MCVEQNVFRSQEKVQRRHDLKGATTAHGGPVPSASASASASLDDLHVQLLNQHSELLRRFGDRVGQGGVGATAAPHLVHFQTRLGPNPSPSGDGALRKNSVHRGIFISEIQSKGAAVFDSSSEIPSVAQKLALRYRGKSRYQVRCIAASRIQSLFRGVRSRHVLKKALDGAKYHDAEIDDMFHELDDLGMGHGSGDDLAAAWDPSLLNAPELHDDYYSFASGDGDHNHERANWPVSASGGAAPPNKPDLSYTKVGSDVRGDVGANEDSRGAYSQQQSAYKPMVYGDHRRRAQPGRSVPTATAAASELHATGASNNINSSRDLRGAADDPAVLQSGAGLFVQDSRAVVVSSWMDDDGEPKNSQKKNQNHFNFSGKAQAHQSEGTPHSQSFALHASQVSSGSPRPSSAMTDSSEVTGDFPLGTGRRRSPREFAGDGEDDDDGDGDLTSNFTGLLAGSGVDNNDDYDDEGDIQRGYKETQSGRLRADAVRRSTDKSDANLIAQEWGIRDPKVLAMMVQRSKKIKKGAGGSTGMAARAQVGTGTGSFGGKPKIVRGSNKNLGRKGNPPAWAKPAGEEDA
jgi:hypothetical protein